MPQADSQAYADSEEARRDVFDCIALFRNPKRRRHSHTDGLSGALFEQQHFNRRESVQEAGAIQNVIAASQCRRVKC